MASFSPDIVTEQYGGWVKQKQQKQAVTGGRVENKKRRTKTTPEH